MDSDLADITLHIDQTLNADEMGNIESILRQHEGVVSARFNPQKHHLMVVEYDPAKVKSLELVGILRHQGLRGELIGL